jgi:hypothetical protein
MKNQDLINQRVRLLISNSNEKAKQKINLFQNDMNNKLLELKKKVDELFETHK